MKGEESKIYPVLSFLSQSIPSQRGSKAHSPKKIHHVKGGSFSHVFAGDTAKPRDYSPQTCKGINCFQLIIDNKIKSKFFEAALKVSNSK